MSRPTRFARAATMAAVLAVLAALAAARPVAAQGTDTLRLSVEDAVALALRAADEVRLSAAQADVADAQLGAAMASGLPQLRVNTTYTHTYESARGQAVGSLFNQPNVYGANLSVGQSLFQGGRIVAGTRAARATRAAVRLDQQEVRARVTLDVQRAYLNVLYDNRMVDIQRSNLTLASSRLAQVEQFEQAGQAARYDVLRARVERANLEPQVIQARNDRQLALLDLKRLLDIPMQQPVSLTTVLDADAVGTVVARLASLADSAALPDRPALRSAELTLQARRQGIAVARADLLPTVSLTFNTGYSAFPPRPGAGQNLLPLRFGLIPSGAGRSSAEFCPAGSAPTRLCQNGGWFSDRSITAAVSVPVFDGLHSRANIELAQAQTRIAEIQLQQQRENVALEVARARAELQRSRALFEARRQNVGEASEAFQLASLRFSRGLSTQLEVSNSQVALLTAQTNEARATYDLYLASAELARALGQPIPLPPSATPQPLRRSSDDRAHRD